MKKVNKGAVVGLVIGIIIAVFGVVQYFGADAAFEQSKADSYSFNKSTPYAVKYSFGADFYTEMFGITYDVLDELGDISSDTARNFTVLNDNLVSGMQNLYQMVCVLLTALGAGVIALSAARFYSYAAGNSEMMKKTVETEARLSEILQKLTNESAQEDSSDAVEQSADDCGEVETPIA